MQTLAIIILAVLIPSVYTTTCSQCIEDAIKVENRLTNITVQIELGQYLNKTICQHLPDPEKDVCGQIVIVDLPRIIDKVVQKYSPEDICQKLGYC